VTGGARGGGGARVEQLASVNAAANAAPILTPILMME
jgi:hypothetical protein